jgi:endonuclease/exonuclease/phosphatase family metal-dependent hydrolase
MGKIYGGLQTFSKYTPLETKRIALPGITDFPRRIFYLERCLLMQRYRLSNGKDLIVINTHFEAYDDGSIKKQQMAVTKKILEEEHAKGNYVVVGGDWNIAPPTFNVHTWEKEPEDDILYLKNNDKDYIPGWNFVYDSTVATNRKNKYIFSGNTFTTVIDYYLTSPNIEIEEVKGFDMGFAFSDHQPVRMKIRLKSN